MNIIILIACFFASVLGIIPQGAISSKTPVVVQEQPASKELIGFDPQTVTQIKTLVGSFFTEVEGRGGFYFPGIHDKAEVLGEMLCNDRRSFESFNPRIECRRTGDLVVQMALSFESYEQCKRFLEYFKANFPNFDKFEIQEGGGGGIIEIGTKGVNKATLMNYLSNKEHLNTLLKSTGYQSGTLMDVRKDLSLIVSDANGTIFPQPTPTLTFQQSHLLSSRANQSILEYLESGGFLVVNSGNEPKRLAGKLLMGIPEEKKYLLKNVAIGAANGHLLFYFNEEGTDVVELASYRKSVPEFLAAPKNKQVQLMYLGDNPKQSGNDWEGFEAAGFDRSICVPSPKNLPLVPSELKGRSFVGNDAATDLVFKAVLEEAKEMREVNQSLAFTPDTVSKIISKVQSRTGNA